MKKKLLTVMMAVMMAFSLSGCGNDVIVDVVTNDVESGSNQTDVSNSGTSQGEQTASAEVAETNPAGLKTIPLEDVKIGVLYIGSASDTSGYTYAHELGIQGMISNLGLKEDQVVRKESIDDGDDVAIKKRWMNVWMKAATLYLQRAGVTWKRPRPMRRNIRMFILHTGPDTRAMEAILQTISEESIRRDICPVW